MGFGLKRTPLSRTVETVHPVLGPVKITFRHGLRNITGRAGARGTTVSAPARASMTDITRVLDLLAERRSKMPEAAPLFTDGTVVDCTELQFLIRRMPAGEGRVRITDRRIPMTGTVTIAAEAPLNPEDPETALAITRIMLRVAREAMKLYVLPEAERIARTLGCRPTGWCVGRGLRTLGTCSSGGRISLSAAVMFLPPDLRRYIICHELAHLTHMDHSPEFHRLCDRYCGGGEKELRRRLREFKWPIIR